MRTREDTWPCFSRISSSFILLTGIRRGEPLPQEVVDYKPNVILAGECVYFEPAFPLLMQTLKDLIALNPDAVIYFCFKKRRRADMQFVKMAKKAFTVEEIFDEDRPVFSRESLFLFAFTAKRNKGVAPQSKKPAEVSTTTTPPPTS